MAHPRLVPEVLEMTIDLRSASLYDRAQNAVSAIRTRTDVRATIAVVLGSGLGRVAEQLIQAVTIPYSEIPGFPNVTVVGHAGRMVIGTIGTIPIAAMQGRFHFYEGYSIDQVTFPIRVLKLLGVET